MVEVTFTADRMVVKGHAEDADDPAAPLEHQVGICATISMALQTAAVFYQDADFKYEDGDSEVRCLPGQARDYLICMMSGLQEAFPKFVRINVPPSRSAS